MSCIIYMNIFKYKSIDFNRLNMIHTPTLNCKICTENQKMHVVITYSYSLLLITIMSGAYS